MRKFKFNTGEIIEIEIYNGGLLYAKYKVTLKTIEVERNKLDKIVFEEVQIINKAL